MNNKNYYLILLAFLIVFIGNTKAQEIIYDTEFGVQPDMVSKDQNGDIILTIMINDNDYNWRCSLMKITPDMDTTVRFISDSLEFFAPRILVTDNNNYLLNMRERFSGESSFDYYSFATFDENLNLLSFRRYYMGYQANGTYLSFIQNDDGRIYGFGAKGSSHDFWALEINEMGDTLRTNTILSYPVPTLYSSVIKSTVDSLSLIAFGQGFDQDNYVTINVDTSLNCTYKEITFLPDYYVQPVQDMRANWLNDSIYMGVGFIPLDAYVKDLLVYKANAFQNHKIVCEPLVISRPDTQDIAALNIPTFVDLNRIYVGSIRGSNPGASYTGRYMVCIIDEDLNIIGMKSIGKEGYQYDMISMQATDDLGCIVAGTVHFPDSASTDWDMFVRKLTPEDIVGVAEQTADKEDSDYFVYPNPGGDILTVATARPKVNLQVFDANGRLLLQERLEKKLNNEINMQSLPSGSYLLRFRDEEGFGETLKWIKE